MLGDSSKFPRLVIIEGADGTGKTTAVKVARAILHIAGVKVASFHHERRGGSNNLYTAALDYAHQRAGMCFATDYADTEVILCDRWWHSSHVEAFRTGNSALGTLAHAEDIALPRPALVIVLDASDHVLDARMRERGEKVTQADRDRRSIYREGAGPAKLWTGASIIHGDAPPVVVINSAGTKEWTAAKVVAEVMKVLGREVSQ